VNGYAHGLEEVAVLESVNNFKIVQIITYLEHTYPELKHFFSAYNFEDIAEAIREWMKIKTLVESAANLGFDVTAEPPKDSVPYVMYEGKYFSEIPTLKIDTIVCEDCGSNMIEITGVPVGCHRSNPNRWKSYIECHACGKSYYTTQGLYQLKHTHIKDGRINKSI